MVEAQQNNGEMIAALDQAMLGAEENKNAQQPIVGVNILEVGPQFGAAVVDDQARLWLGLFPGDQEWVRTVATITLGLKDLQCGICHMTGHKKAQCWVNGALYEWCRAAGDMGPNYRIRSAIKANAKIARITELRQVQDAAAAAARQIILNG